MTFLPDLAPRALRISSRVAASALLPLLLFGPSGCALTDVTVHPPAPGQVIAQSGVGRGREVVVMAPFADYRAVRDRCGMKKNGYNTDSADVNCAVQPTDWVTHALIDGLAASGFRVLVNQAGSTASTPRIDGQLLQFFVEPKLDPFTVTPEADIAVTLRMSTPSGLAAERVFYFKGREPTMFGTDDTFDDAAKNATREAVAGMVAAIVELLDRYPQLGATAPPAAVSMNGGPQ
jgi:hypothetical protein